MVALRQVKNNAQPSKEISLQYTNARLTGFAYQLGDWKCINNGLEIPAIGLGTYQIEPVQEIIEKAILMGYRLIDTAKMYKNEKEIGESINKLLIRNYIKLNKIISS